MYIAKTDFRDTQDRSFLYHKGDEYPRQGYTPDKSRLESLLSDNNRRGEPVIEEAKAEKTPAAQEKPKRGRKTKDAE